jgi:hypothetical protein
MSSAEYIAGPALPAEQQDPELNPGGGDLGWVVIRQRDDVMIAFGDGYMTEDVARARAQALNQGRPGTDVVNR